MKKSASRSRSGSTLIFALSVIVIFAVMIGAALNYTQHTGRLAQRTRISQTAMEIGDGCLEVLFTHWRNTYRSTAALVLPTNYFYTTTYHPLASGTGAPALIPTPKDATNNSTLVLFPDVPQTYTISNYRIQAVNPMVELYQDFPSTYPNPSDPEHSVLTDGTTPSAAYGPSLIQYSLFYLASADVTFPALNGKSVTSKVRRVFEKKFNMPFQWAMFYNDNLEIHPSASLTINGPVQTNSNLYTASNLLTFTDKTNYNGSWNVGYATGDTVHTATPAAPNYPSTLPPSQDITYLPFGWNAAQMFNLGDGNPNNEGYREIIERPVSGYTDAVSTQRYYNQAGIKVLIDASYNLTVYDEVGNQCTSSSSNNNDKNIYNTVNSAISKNDTFQDSREGATMHVATFDISKLTTAVNNGTLKNSTGGTFNGVIYFSDTSAITSGVNNHHAIRLKNASTLPTSGFTFVSDNAVYIKGDFNTGSSPPSNSGTPTDPDGGGYTRAPAAIIADAVTLQSNAWSDSGNSLSTRTASNTTVNAAIIAGSVPSGTSGGNYSGGAENFVRLMENWTGKTFTYYGSMIQLWNSQQATGLWGTANVYNAPTQYIYYDTTFAQKWPPGNLFFASYLQQQRWYVVY